MVLIFILISDLKIHKQMQNSKDYAFRGHPIFGKAKRSNLIKSLNDKSEEKDISSNFLSFSYNKYNSVDEEVYEYLLDNSFLSISEDEIKKNAKWFNDNYY